MPWHPEKPAFTRLSVKILEIWNLITGISHYNPNHLILYF